MQYDLIIIGGGPAAIAGGVYAGRKKIKTLLITEAFGGQSVVAENIENFVGIKSISGLELKDMLEGHLRAHPEVEIREGEKVEKVEKIENGFKVTTNAGSFFESKTVLVASGNRRRSLNVPGDEKFSGRGISYCATCDAPVFKGKAVAVVGGGNAGLEAVLDLAKYTTKIYLLNRGESLKGDLTTQDKIKAITTPPIEIINMASTSEVLGNDFVTGLRYTDLKTNETKEIAVDGIFVEIGSVPNSDFVKDLVELNPAGDIVTDPKTQATSIKGIWAAGDVTDGLYEQNNISIGDGIKALMNIDDYLKKQ